MSPFAHESNRTLERRRPAVCHQGFRNTHLQSSAEEKIRVPLESLRGEESIATLCRRKGIVLNLYRAPSDRVRIRPLGRWLTR